MTAVTGHEIASKGPMRPCAVYIMGLMSCTWRDVEDVREWKVEAFRSEHACQTLRDFPGPLCLKRNC